MPRNKLVARRGSDVARWCAEFEQACRARGVRVTPQRLAVYRALAADLTHPTADTVLGGLRDEMPSLSPASVYRILESLEHEGLVRRVGTTDGIARYDANLERHQHLVCRKCGRMTDFQSPELSSIRLARRLAPGFVVEEVDVRLVGRCARCVPAVPRRRGRGRRAEAAY
jgi:Fur family transcriptional regulator, peroxide stress response regulator